jgi:hypothetical protein
MNARRLIARIVALSSLTMLLGGGCMKGCVDFDSQTIELHHDVARDTLDLLLIDRGLQASEGDVAHAMEQLQTARGRRVFSLISTMLTFDLDGALGTEINPRLPGGQVLESLRDAEVHDLGFWVDGSGQLCAAQHVRIPGVEAVLQRISASFVAWLVGHDRDLEELAETCGLTEPGDVAAIRAALAAQPDFPMVQMRGSALAFSLPLDDAHWLRARAFALQRLADMQSRAEAGDAQARIQRDLLLAMDVGLVREGDRASIVIGNPGRDSVCLEVPPVGKHGASLVATLRDHGWVLAGPEGEAAARAAYAAAVGP